MSIDLGAGIPAGVRTKVYIKVQVCWLVNNSILQLTFITWSPEKSKIRQRMVSASSKDALKKRLDGVQVEWQLTGADELEASDRIDDLSCLPWV